MFRKVTCIITIVLLLFLLIGCIRVVEYVPREGIWYCEELQMQISYNRTQGTSANQDTYVIIDGQKIICDHGWSDARDKIMVDCGTNGCTNCPKGAKLLWAKGLLLTETEMVVYDEDSQKAYVFLRIDY